MFLFRRERTLGFRQFNMVCTSCGGAFFHKGGPLSPPWRCPLCGKEVESRKISLADRAQIETEMKLIWKRRPWIYAMSYGRASLPERLLAKLQLVLGRIRFFRSYRR